MVQLLRCRTVIYFLSVIMMTFLLCLIGVLQYVCCYYILKKSRQRAYVKKGCKERSFVYHGLAACYEHSLEYDNQVDADGNDELAFRYGNKLYHVFSRPDHTFCVERYRFFAVRSEDNVWANSYMEERQRENPDLVSRLERYERTQEWLVSVGAVIRGDATEKDARNYIFGLIEEVVDNEATRLMNAYCSYCRERDRQGQP